ncbi:MULTISPECIES: FMN-dependent NADH-azoreductase [Pseudomonas]|uniref:FMN dependent NADH:quinone oxidoreductase n=2 Tax=Pseudomonas putida group TaxID=136845 RepID=A0AAE6RJ15_9PSED|nr:MULTISPECIES: NAD(P)H-dependent oxidoreductase [Pseudomonas]MDD2126791.1 NAD(P)H-dependent oxidoreductase [Pseudomonas monteilii]NBB05187.1 flavodoxin family protein [Pseudomonas monteilii]QHB30720.1 FMN-dependent NADH-azoreductase [Pseudomonas monteilii]SMC33921.1 FMN-dependent NADH-azoreductase [Pseudomonas sp. URIL14HWK12:I5]BBU42569.1 FMN-dependent NADH-azoreductase 1 [Pseudomonas putida]
MTSSQQPLAPLRILRLVTSPNAEASESLKLSQQILFALASQAGRRGIQLTDLDLNALAPVDAPYAQALANQRVVTVSGRDSTLSRSNELIDQLQACDVLLIATPMHNYSVPAPLKMWIDQVVRVGKTFVGTAKGKIGKLTDRPVYVAIASGGYISGPQARQPDFLRPYLSAVLATIGLTQVHYFTVEGTAKGVESLSTGRATGYGDVQAFFGRHSRRVGQV